MSEEPWRRNVDCLDVGGRPRQLAVTVGDEGHLVLRPPPGEFVALLLTTGAQLLVMAVGEAQLTAASHRLERHATPLPGPGQVHSARSFVVRDLYDQSQPLSVGISDEDVVMAPPAWWRADLAVAIAIGSALISHRGSIRDRRRLR